MTKKVLVTGGAGFIGSHVVDTLGKSYEQVVVYDNLATGVRSNLDGLSCELVQGDILDSDKLGLAMRDCDLVIHLAAEISVAASMVDPQKCVDTNVSGLLNVARCCVETGVRKIVFASSAAVYGDTQAVRKQEGDLPEPKSPYAITKLDGEHYLQMFHHECGLLYTAFRFFNVFGPRQDPNGPYAAAIPSFMSRALVGDDIHVFGDGEQTRDFIHVRDVARAVEFAAASDSVNGIYNLAGGVPVSINDIVRGIVELTNSSSEIYHVDERPGDIKHSLADVSKIEAAGFSPAIVLKDGLRSMLES